MAFARIVAGARIGDEVPKKPEARYGNINIDVEELITWIAEWMIFGHAGTSGRPGSVGPGRPGHRPFFRPRLISTS